MVFATHSEPNVQLAIWIGAGSVIVTVVLLIQIIWMRMALLAHRFLQRRFAARWQPILIQSLAGEKPQLPELHPKELVDLLLLWVRLHKTVRGEASQHLNRLLIRLSVDKDVLRLLRGRKLDERLIAITVSGFLGIRDAWGDLTTMLQDPLPAISITAARALIRIDEEQASTHIIPMIIQRRDWTIDRTAVMLKEAGPKLVEAFVVAVEQAEAENQPYLLRLMRILDVLQVNRPLPFLRHMLEFSDNPELVSSALRLVRTAEDLDLVRNRIKDSNWSVQVQVATVLGRLGSQEDIHRLVSLMNSKEWWVRYRAAKSLIQLPFVTNHGMELIKKGLSDNFARDILSQTMAEQVQ